MKQVDWQEVKTVYFKDLTEVWRDHRTLIIMILMPTLVYPLLLAVPSHVSRHMSVELKSKKCSVALLGDFGEVASSFEKSKKLNLISTKSGDTPESLLEAKRADVVVSFPPAFVETVDSLSEKIPTVTIYYDARKEESIFAVINVKTLLGEFRRQCLAGRFKTLSVKAPKRYEMQFLEVGAQADSASEPVRDMLPFMLFTMLSVAIIYPALDVITGERERNTLTLLLLSPSGRRNIMIGKLMVVSSIGFLAMAIGLLAIFICVNFVTARGGDITFTFPFKALFMCFLVCTPLVLALSALAIMLASACKTFQQGQGYFAPFLILFMASSAVSSLPELKLSSGIALIPVLNNAIALKEVLTGHGEPLWLFVSFAVSFIFAACLAHQSSHLLDSEHLLLGISDSKARRRQSGDFLPEVGLLVVIVFLMMFYIGQSLQLWDPLLGTILTQMFVILAPALILVRYLKLPVLATLSLRRPSLRSFAGAVLLSPACLLLSMGAYNAQCAVVPAPEAFNQMFARFFIDNGKPVWLLLLAIGICPGICEELLFRGAILGLLKQRLKPLSACLLVGVLFGFFHLSVFRFFPTAILGIVLTAVCLLTGSIVPSMVIHALHNTAAVLLSKFGWEPLVFQYWYLPVLSGLIGLWLLKLPPIFKKSV